MIAAGREPSGDDPSIFHSCDGGIGFQPVEFKSPGDDPSIFSQLRWEGITRRRQDTAGMLTILIGQKILFYVSVSLW